VTQRITLTLITLPQISITKKTHKDKDLQQIAELNGIGKFHTSFDNTSKLSEPVRKNTNGLNLDTNNDEDNSKTSKNNNDALKKNSMDACSDLAISSYSVSSGLFRDSYSDDLQSPTSPNNDLLAEFNNNSNPNEDYQLTFDNEPKPFSSMKKTQKTFKKLVKAKISDFENDKTLMGSLKLKRKHSGYAMKKCESSTGLNITNMNLSTGNVGTRSVLLDGKQVDKMFNVKRFSDQQEGKTNNIDEMDEI